MTVARDISAQKREEARLRDLAERDALTGIYGRGRLRRSSNGRSLAALVSSSGSRSW